MPVAWVAALAGVHVSTVYRWLKSGRLRSLGLNDVAALLREQYVRDWQKEQRLARRGKGKRRRAAFAPGGAFRRGPDGRRSPLRWYGPERRWLE